MTFDINIDGTNSPVQEGEDVNVNYTVTNNGANTDKQHVQLFVGSAPSDGSDTDGTEDDYLDMEGSTVTSQYSSYDTNNWDMDGTNVRSGSTALHGWVAAGDNWGGNVKYTLGDEGFAANVDELHQRIWFYIPSGHSMTTDDNMRLWNSALADGSGNSGGGYPDGTNGWSNRIYVTERGNRSTGNWNLLTYTYDMDKSSAYPTNITLEADLATDTWHQLDTYVTVNTWSGSTANKDGIVRIWCNEELLHDETHRFTIDSSNRIQWCGPVIHYGGGYTSPEYNEFWYDDHYLWVDQGPQL